MAANVYGPVAKSQMKDESGAIFDALEDGWPVLISDRGEVVAVIEPVSPEWLVELVAFALPGSDDELEATLTASDINYSAGPIIDRAIEGETVRVAKLNKLFGIMVGADRSPTLLGLPSAADLEAVDQALERHVEAHGAPTSIDEYEQLRASIAEKVTGRSDRGFQIEVVATEPLARFIETDAGDRRPRPREEVLEFLQLAGFGAAAGRRMPGTPGQGA